MKKNNHNLVSIIIPVLNEEKYIESCINSVVLATDDIEGMELLIIDGGSKDGTLSIIKKLMKLYPFIQLLHNEKKTTPKSLNIGIKHSTGKYIIRLDAHVEYSPGYINQCVESLENSTDDIANIGGDIITKPGGDNIIAKSISLVLSSRMGVGNSAFRVKKTLSPRFVETVPFGAFKREALENVGLFNEEEPRNEDLELNRRLIKSGKKILHNPNINSTYFSRGDYKSFIKHQFDNGWCVTKSFRGSESFHNIRHFIPLIFILYLIFLLFLSFSPVSRNQSSIFFIFLTPILIYTSLIILITIYDVFKNFNLMYFMFIPITYILLHISYGLGSLYGIIILAKNLVKKDF